MTDDMTINEDVIATYRYNRKVFQITLTLSGESIVVSSLPTKPVYRHVGPMNSEAEVIHTDDNKTDEPNRDMDKGGDCVKCGKPKGTCKGCDKSNTSNDEKRSVAGIIKGAVGLAKSELGIGAASKKEIDDRRAICIGCDKQVLGVCSECGCYCAAKVKIAKERCPIGKWGD